MLIWKKIGYGSTFLLFLFSIAAVGIISWYYQTVVNGFIWELFDEQMNAYVQTIRAIIACDVLFIVACLIGFCFLFIPHPASQFYSLFIGLMVIYKIVVGAVFYSGVDEEGRDLNSGFERRWDYCNGTCDNDVYAWSISRSFEIVTIVFFTTLGLLSGLSVWKTHSTRR